MNYLKCQKALNDIDRYLRDHNFETTYTHIGSLGFSNYDVKIRRRTIEASRVLYDIDIHPWPMIQAQLDILIYHFESREKKMNNIAFDISRDGPVGKLVIKDNVYDVCVKEVNCDRSPYNEKTYLNVEVTGKDFVRREVKSVFVAEKCLAEGFAKGVAETYNPTRKDSINDGKLQIKDVIFNPPATIVLWSDGSKTVVKAENEVYDPEKGLAMAIAKRAMGNQGNYFDTFKKYIEKYEDKCYKEYLAFRTNLLTRIFHNTTARPIAKVESVEETDSGVTVKAKLNEPKKPYKIYYECDDTAYEPASKGVCQKEYVKAGNAMRAAMKRFAGKPVRWMVAQENPWANGEWVKKFGSDK